MVIISEEEYLAHYGILRKSGRYPWGSGDNTDTVQQRSQKFLDMYNELKRRLGLGEAETAKMLGLVNHKGEGSTKQLREAKVIAKNELQAAKVAHAHQLQERGYSNSAAAREMGIPESSYRQLIAPGAADKAQALHGTANILRDEVDQKKIMDIGEGTENYLGVSKERKDVATAMLVDEGYVVFYPKVQQAATGKDTTVKVIAVPGTTYAEVAAALRAGNVPSMQKYSEDGGRSPLGIVPPLGIKSDRIGVRYAEQGGTEADGVIFVRRGVPDVSLGGKNYAQVRIKVDDHHYLKGMAVYKDDLPEGVDLVFNTNKSDTGKKHDAFKDMRDEVTGDVDPDNPFGSWIRRQITEKDANGNERATSVMNLVNEEGDWTDWSRTIASQVLSKQDPELARAQLNMTLEQRKFKYDEIMAVTNPTVKKRLLEEFADEADSASVHLAAASLPRQRWQVILPIETLGDHEIYAPHFENGERVALIRYPHGGTFEIPELTVNNKHQDSRRTLGLQPRDAVGINARVAQHLSGADFDGDTVLVIPNNAQRVRTSKPLQQLKGFDTRAEYPAYDGMKTIDGGTWNAATGTVDYGGRKPNTQRMQAEMGNVSNLITDMTIKGAPHSEIAQAVRHSMVIIDSEKHRLNYRQSAVDNGIAALKEKYQSSEGSSGRGAATIISRAKSPVRVDERKDRLASQGGPIDPATGKRMYQPTGRTYLNKEGVVTPKTTKTTKLAEAEDAFELSSGTQMEAIYAIHSNALKGMANEARRQSLLLPPTVKSKTAEDTYSNEVASLNAKLDLVARNKPLERQAQILQNSVYRQRRDANPNMDDETKRKIRTQSLEEARRRTGADRAKIEVTPSEWDAIQAGAISNTKLTQIMNAADMDSIKKLATPREAKLMSPAKLDRARQMVELGYTQAEIASALGVSTTTLDRAIHERVEEGE
jgi:predicted transcriptional regulator